MHSHHYLLVLLAAACVAQQDLTQHVDVFHGSTNGGNMFPGVVAGPFANVKLGPDLNGGDAAKSGFMPAGKITGFSMMHESGTGGAPKYGVVSQLPVVGPVDNPLNDLSASRSAPDTGSVGYYKSMLSNGVIAELAASAHAGFFQYTFPPGQGANVLVDVSHFLPSNRPDGFSQAYTKGDLQTFPDGHYEGSGTYHGGWNLTPDWTVYFCGRFNGTTVSAKTFAGTNNTLSQFGQSSVVSSTERVGALFSFKESIVTSRVGLSFISSEKACQFVDEEIPAASTLQNVIDQSKARWNSEVLSKVTTTETNSSMLTQLYTTLYGIHLLPSNRTGENPNPNWNASEPYYDDLYTLWDLFRCTTPLFQVLQPVAYEEFIRSLVEVYRTDGYLPDARSSNFNGRTQGGSNADNVLADAYVKGVRGQVNWDLAYEAMVKDAEVAPPNNNDPSAKDSSTKEGRGALPDWLKLGYITTTYTRSVTRAVEYSVNDFSLYQVGKGMGKPSSEFNKYLSRSRNWRHHWDSTVTSFNTTGFLVPRKPDGTFISQDPMKCGGCYWGDSYYEGRPWEYTVNAHHDLATLINFDHGNDNFYQRLSTLMDPARKIFDPGNEPSFATPYLFNFINRQAESVKRARFVAKTQYSNGPGGLPGNSDAGAMQSWLLWNMIGLYPLTGQTTFLISSPWLADLTIDLGGGKSLQISSTNGNNSNAIFVQSLKVNGKSWDQNWLSWDDVFANGGKMEFVLGTQMTQWDTGALPPSPASVGDNGRSQGEQGSGLVARQKHHANEKLRKVGIWLGIGCSIVLLGCNIAAFWLWRRGVWGGRYQQRPADAEVPEERGGRDSEELPPIDVLPNFTAENVVKSKTATTIVENSVSESGSDDGKSSTRTPPPGYTTAANESTATIKSQGMAEGAVSTTNHDHQEGEIQVSQHNGTKENTGKT